MIKKIFQSFALLMVLASVSACGKQLDTGSKYETGPVGPGSSVQELKQSPCACVEIPMHIPDSTGLVSNVNMYGI
mgnify:CR=1 FL=1